VVTLSGQAKRKIEIFPVEKVFGQGQGYFRYRFSAEQRAPPRNDVKSSRVVFRMGCPRAPDGPELAASFKRLEPFEKLFQRVRVKTHIIVECPDVLTLLESGLHPVMVSPGASRILWHPDIVNVGKLRLDCFLCPVAAGVVDDNDAIRGPVLGRNIPKKALQHGRVVV
jgi:hypothetical protein